MNGQIPANGTPPVDGAPPVVDAPPVDAPLMKSIIPEEYHDKEYLKGWLDKPVSVEAHAEVFKKLVNSQSLLGQKTGVPANDAPAEEWEIFYKQLRPESAEAYEFVTKEGSEPDVDLEKAMKSVFHKAGLTPAQAKDIHAGFQEVAEGRASVHTEAQKKSDEEFEGLLTATFGKDNEAIVAGIRAELDASTPENLKPHLAKLSNENLAILAGVIHAIKGKYTKEDNIASKGGDAASQLGLREEGRTLMASKAYKDSFHADHAATRARVTAIYAQLGKVPQA